MRTYCVAQGTLLKLCRDLNGRGNPKKEGVYVHTGFPGGAVVQNLPTTTGDLKDTGSIPRSGRNPGEGNGNPLPVFLLGEFHGQRSLAGYSPQGRKELDMTEETQHAGPHMYTYC